MARARKGTGMGKADRGPQKAQGSPRFWPVTGILLGGTAVVALLGLSTYRPRAIDENWAGPVGHGVANALLDLAGLGAYAVALFLLAIGCALACTFYTDSLRSGR